MNAYVRTNSALFGLAVELYQRHQPNDANYCLTCARLVCPVRTHAAAVIAAAGVNPSRYDPRPSPRHSSVRKLQPTASLCAQRGPYDAT